MGPGPGTRRIRDPRVPQPKLQSGDLLDMSTNSWVMILVVLEVNQDGHNGQDVVYMLHPEQGRWCAGYFNAEVHKTWLKMKVA